MKQEINNLVQSAQNFLILQADNPDADSLGSSLALEQILGEMGKQVHMYCAIDMPTYLRYMKGWDRVTNTIPKQFDVSIIVDASTMTLFSDLVDTGTYKLLSNKPCIVLDHHSQVDNIITFATINLTETNVSSTGELIYNLASNNSWKLDKTSAEYIMSSILGDTQGLTNELTTAQTYRVMAELTDLGVNRPYLEEKRRSMSKLLPQIFRYKARLMERTELLIDGKLALVDIPDQEIKEYSPLYNPNALIQFEHLQIDGVAISISIKHYSDGRITAGIRCNQSAPIASKLAEHFGGGGHKYSAGFKITDGTSFREVKNQCITTVNDLLNIAESNGYETI